MLNWVAQVLFRKMKSVRKYSKQSTALCLLVQSQASWLLIGCRLPQTVFTSVISSFLHILLITPLVSKEQGEATRGRQDVRFNGSGRADCQFKLQPDLPPDPAFTAKLRGRSNGHDFVRNEVQLDMLVVSENVKPHELYLEQQAGPCNHGTHHDNEHSHLYCVDEKAYGDINKRYSPSNGDRRYVDQ